MAGSAIPLKKSGFTGGMGLCIPRYHTPKALLVVGYFSQLKTKIDLFILTLIAVAIYNIQLYTFLFSFVYYMIKNIKQGSQFSSA